MINLILSALLICLFLITGKLIPAIKKVIGLITTCILKVLNFFRIRLNFKRKRVKVSIEFKHIYEDIKIVKKSKTNLKEIKSIDWVNFSIFTISLLLVILNLEQVTNYAISDWMYTLLDLIIPSKESMNVTFTATLFSAMSFSLTGMLYRWKETKESREEKKRDKLKLKALTFMDSKELLDNAKKKDDEKYKELK